MRLKYLLPVLLVLLTPALAQQPDRVELFGGYSYTRYSVYDPNSNSWNRFGYNGWDAAATAKLTAILAAEADFAGGSGSPDRQSSTLHTYMIGPRVFGNFGRATVYGHVLFGGLNFNIAGLSSTSFAADFGAGADLWLTHHFGARLIQADYIESDNIAAARGVSSTYSRNQGRISTGLDFRFGH